MRKDKENMMGNSEFYLVRNYNQQHMMGGEGSMNLGMVVEGRLTCGKNKFYDRCWKRMATCEDALVR